MNIPRLINAWKHALRRDMTGSISRGNITFFTKFGWLTINIGDSRSTSPNRLKIVRLAKSMRAKSKCPSFSNPHFA
jgi:hypothetical protein